LIPVIVNLRSLDCELKVANLNPLFILIVEVVITQVAVASKF